MDGMELQSLFNSCFQGKKRNNCLLMPLKSSILFKVSSAQQSKIGSGRVSVPRNDRYRMMTLPDLHVFSSCVKASCYKSYNPFPLPERPWAVSHTVKEINRGAELLEEVSSSLLDQSTDEAADIEDGEIESNHERGDVEGITKGLLEWPKICTQVAQFACTPMGILVAREGYLPIGASVDESEELQAQTEAARSLSTPLNFSGIEDLRGIVAGALSGNVCTVTQLCAVKKTLSSARRLHDQVQQGPALISPLQSIMVGSSLCVELEASIEQCLDCSFSTVLDSASSKLAAVRRRRQQNMSSLEALLKQTAMMVADKGGMDSPLVTRRRARLCVAVRASHKGLLSGGVTLDVSNSGATLFMEPEPALEFNNEEIRLAAAEQAEETAVLQSLTFTLIDMSESMIDLLQRVTALDLACARAGYAMWLNAVRPVFCENDRAFFHKNPYMDQLMVDIEGARHPLLLGTALSASLNTQWHGVIHQNKINTGSSSSSISTGNASSFGFIETTLPVPIDIKICESVKVVTITGPNTGGKTATLKTLGVIVLMAKAGLFVPAVGQPQLPWFDRILADIGDNQSLERSLSTFSGHIRRVCEILEAGTKKSLVLLDEIGGGTDPSEGAALATAVLGSLASSVQLTLATTHSAELRRLKDQDPQFENASVEFDVKTLQPTYRVLWGVAGQSNALDIAASLGFDQNVLTRAQELVTKLVPATLGERTSELMVPLVKQRDEQRERAQAAGVALAAITKLHYELQAEVHNLAKREAKLRHLQEEEVDRSIMEANARMEQVLTRFQELVQESGLKENPLSMRDAQAAIATIAEEYNPKHGEVDMPFLQKNGSDGTKGVLAVGDKVVIRRLGKLPATVVEPPQGDSEYLTVQLGALKMKVKASEIITRGSTGASGERSVRTSIQQLVKPIQSKQPEIPAAEPKYEVAVQTSRNTLDLRGCRVEESLQELDRALASRAPQSVLFVVHGMGTGAVKEAVWKVLKKHPYVAKFEQESIMNPGCTIVYIK